MKAFTDRIQALGQLAENVAVVGDLERRRIKRGRERPERQIGRRGIAGGGTAAPYGEREPSNDEKCTPLDRATSIALASDVDGNRTIASPADRV